MIKTIQNLSKSVFVSLLFFISSCANDPNSPGDRATVTGPDLRECASCCGGWWIDIGEEQYRFRSIPFSAMIDLENETFPVEVAVIWRLSDNTCNEDITLISIQRID